MKPRFSVIVPAHNEEARIERTLLDYARVFDDSEIIVVLNGCTDGTEAIVERIRALHGNVKGVHIEHAVGKGGAVRAGLLIARAPFVGYVDADGSTRAVEMRRLFEGLNGHDAVIASRWMTGAKIEKAQPFRRRLASRAFNALVRFFFGLRLHDTQCGAKVFRASCLGSVMREIETSNMAFDVDLLYSLSRHGYRIKEEPTEWRDVAGSRVELVRASAKMLSALLRLRLRHSALHYTVPLFDRFFPTAPMRVHD